MRKYSINAATYTAQTMSSFGWRLYNLQTKLWEWKRTGKIQSLLVNPFPHDSNDHVSFILGHKDFHELRDNWTDKNDKLLDQMLGPNGFLVYNVLLQQAIAREEDKHDYKVEVEPDVKDNGGG